jgi:hypothetical protein
MLFIDTCNAIIAAAQSNDVRVRFNKRARGELD